jgi:hypothetical protein
MSRNHARAVVRNDVAGHSQLRAMLGDQSIDVRPAAAVVPELSQSIGHRDNESHLRNQCAKSWLWLLWV